MRVFYAPACICYAGVPEAFRRRVEGVIDDYDLGRAGVGAQAGDCRDGFGITL